MAALKSLFRRKSKKELRSDRSTTPTPSPGRSPSSLGRHETPVSSPPIPPLPSSVTPTQHRARPSQGGTPAQQQYTTPLGGSGAPRYEDLPSGSTPEKGAYPLHGNGGPGFSSQQSPTQSRSVDNRSNSVGRASGPPGVPVPARRSIPPGTAVTTDTSYANAPRSSSRSSAYSDTSRYSEFANTQRYRQSDDVPPVPKPYEASSSPPDKRSASGAFSNGDQSMNHLRMASASSTASVPRTPIADEFAAPTWYTQSGSPPIPEFSHVHATQANKSKLTSTGAPNTANVAVTQGAYRNNTTSEMNAPQRAPLRDGIDAAGPMDRSAALGRVLNNSKTDGLDVPRQNQRQQEPPVQAPRDATAWSNGDASAASQPRRASIPRKSLDKPLPIPAKLQSAGNLNGSDVPHGQDIPTRERAPPAAPLATTNLTERTPNVAGTNGATPSSPIRAGKYTKSPSKALSKGEVRSGPQQVYNRPYMVQGSNIPPSLEGIVDLNNTVDTTTHVHYAPAVVHETIFPSVHHIREEQITREIHEYDVHHRILPIVDVQVLPPKHIVRSNNAADGEWIEVAEQLVPGRQHYNWVIAETVSRIPGTLDRAAQTPLQFTARTFDGTEGDYREYVNADGVATTETTWVHPPTISQDARLRGISLPLDMD